MSDLKLFRVHHDDVTELAIAPPARERHLQKLVEAHMETLLGVRFLASEHTTGKTHRGRIDSLGLDENNCPVIVEYKRHSNTNVINQGRFYLDWLLDHQADFLWLVMKKLGKTVADQVEWSGPRLLCIASDFTRYDQHAVQQIARNIELLRYKLFDGDLLLLELVNAQSAPAPKAEPAVTAEASPAGVKPTSKDKTFAEQLDGAAPVIRALYADLRSFLLALGDDVTEKPLKRYTAFRKLRNFACVVVSRNKMQVTLTLKPDTVALETGFSRDVSEVGHWGTGHLELTLRSATDLARARPLLERAYQEG